MGELAYKYSDLPIYSNDQVEALAEEFEVLELIVDDQSQGFVTKDELKAYITDYPEILDENILVKEYMSDETSAIHSHPYFQRRKPQVIPSQTNENNFVIREFLVLVNGKKSGPYNSDQIIDMVKNGELLFTDLICPNDTPNSDWKKLYLYKDFDRRNLEQSKDDLPIIPKRNTFEDSKIEVYEHIDEPSIQNMEKEAVAGLAYMGKILTGKANQNDRLMRVKSKDIDLLLQEDNKEVIPKHELFFNFIFKHKKIFQGIIIGATGLVFCSYLVSEIGSLLKSDIKKAKVVKRKAVINKVDTNLKIPKKVTKPKNKLELDNKTSNKRNNLIKSKNSSRYQNATAPFNESETYRDQIGEQDYYDRYDDVYDDGESSFENDPVRSKVSKETYDPYLELINEERVLEEQNRDPANDALIDAIDDENLGIEEEIFDQEQEY